jgi:hypothetical protein
MKHGNWGNVEKVAKRFIACRRWLCQQDVNEFFQPLFYSFDALPQ